jgi:hypothetical protein
MNAHPLPVGHPAATVARCGWAGIKIGKLRAIAAAKFDVFLTLDQNVEYQQGMK